MAMNDVTRILSQIDAGDPSAAEQLLPLVYDELRRLAAAKLAAEKPGQTLQATALVHEAYLRLLGSGSAENWNSRGHFFGAAAEAMRRILVERARQKLSVKGGRELQRVESVDLMDQTDSLPIDLIALDDALRQLEAAHPRKAELIKLRFYAGLTSAQAAEALGVSATTADNDWAYAKTWLKLRM